MERKNKGCDHFCETKGTTTYHVIRKEINKCQDHTIVSNIRDNGSKNNLEIQNESQLREQECSIVEGWGGGERTKRIVCLGHTRLQVSVLVETVVAEVDDDGRVAVQESEATGTAQLCCRRIHHEGKFSRSIV